MSLEIVKQDGARGWLFFSSSVQIIAETSSRPRPQPKVKGDEYPESSLDPPKGVCARETKALRAWEEGFGTRRKPRPRGGQRTMIVIYVLTHTFVLRLLVQQHLECLRNVWALQGGGVL